MLKHLIIQMFVVLQAPMHACALHYDTIECLASCRWQHEYAHAKASDHSDIRGATVLRIVQMIMTQCSA
jgi:hypothetical protein